MLVWSVGTPFDKMIGIMHIELLLLLIVANQRLQSRSKQKRSC